MGLRADLEKVFTDNMSDADGEEIELTPFQKKKLKQLANGLADTFIDFLQKQEFQITEMEATVDIEEIKSVAPLTSVPNGGGPIVIGGSPSSPTPFALSSRGGNGWPIIPKAKAYIGPKSTNNVYGRPNVDKTKVKLLNVKNR